MKVLTSIALAAGVLLATAGSAQAAWWGNSYNYGYGTPYTGYYPPQAYGNYNYNYGYTNPYTYNSYGAYYGTNPYYGYNNYNYNSTGSVIRRIGNSLLRNLF